MNKFVQVSIDCWFNLSWWWRKQDTEADRRYDRYLFGSCYFLFFYQQQAERSAGEGIWYWWFYKLCAACYWQRRVSIESRFSDMEEIRSDVHGYQRRTYGRCYYLRLHGQRCSRRRIDSWPLSAAKKCQECRVGYNKKNHYNSFSEVHTGRYKPN